MWHDLIDDMHGVIRRELDTVSALSLALTCRYEYQHRRDKATRTTLLDISIENNHLAFVDIFYQLEDTGALRQATRYGHLDTMKWLKEQGCPWGSYTFAGAAEHGNLDNMKWLKEQDCPWDSSTFACAARHGNLDNMKWLKEQGCPWGLNTFSYAIQHANPDNMNWLKEQDCPQ